MKELNGEECHHLRKNAKIRHIEYTNIARSFKILAQTKRIVAEVFSFLLFSSEKFDYCMIFFFIDLTLSRMVDKILGQTETFVFILTF